VSDWSRVRFRAWLIGKVLETQNLAKVCCVAVYQKRVDDVARKTGLHPSLVEEVGREYARRVVASGRPVPTGAKTSSADYPQLKLRMPVQPHDAWKALCARMHMKPTVALRTLVHEYLLGADEPLHRDERWVVGGHVISGPAERSVEPGATHGAISALNTRAQKLGLTQRALLRCLVVDALAGRRRIGAPISRAAMFDDASRYRR